MPLRSLSTVATLALAAAVPAAIGAPSATAAPTPPAAVTPSGPAVLTVGIGTSDWRGDFTGDGTKDELAIDTAGNLIIFPSQPDGTWGPATHLIDNFDAARSITWLASPGDLDGDRYQDLLALTKNGDLKFIALTRGGIKTSKTVGVGFNQMDVRRTTVLRDFSQGHHSLVAVNATDCNLYRYDLALSGGDIISSARIGNGWCGMKQIFALGDVRKNQVPSLGAISTTTGDLYEYTAAAVPVANQPGLSLGQGHLGAGQIIGNGWNFRQVTNNGTVDKGVGTLVAVTDAGSVYQYQTTFAPQYWGQVTTPAKGVNLTRDYAVVE